MGGGGGGGSTSSNRDARTDSGWISSTTIAQAAAIAVAGINTAAMIAMNSEQVSIARGHLDLARQLRDYWNAVYVPYETMIVNEVCNEPRYVPQYDLTAGRYIASIRSQFAKQRDKIRCIGRYCTGLTAAMVKDMAIAEATAAGNAMNFAYRYEEARKEAKDDVRFARIMKALSLGRNLVAESLTAAQAAGNAYGNLGQQAAAGVSGAMKAFEYYGNKNPTEYPQNQGYSLPRESQGGTFQYGGAATGGRSDFTMPSPTMPAPAENAMITQQQIGQGQTVNGVPVIGGELGNDMVTFGLSSNNATGHTGGGS